MKTEKQWIGVISDTHGLLRPQAAEALKGSYHILHAGDVGSSEVLNALKEIAPVTAVCGNMDDGALGRQLPPAALEDIMGIRFYILHDLYELDLTPSKAEIRMVIHGHTHRPDISESDGVIYLNPGSAGPRRYDYPVTVAKISVNGGSPVSEIVHIL